MHQGHSIVGDYPFLPGWPCCNDPVTEMGLLAGLRMSEPEFPGYLLLRGVQAAFAGLMTWPRLKQVPQLQVS